MKRIGIIALLHESNTFLQEPTTEEHFRGNLLATGEDVLTAFRGTQHEVGGCLAVLDQHPEIQTVGIFAARAMPYGTITAECWTSLMNQLETRLRSTLPVDGLLVAPHGATVAENAPDADGDWLHRVRALVGPSIPIIGTLDLHANVSPLMVSSCQALFGYRTNPHLDQRARGVQAATTLLRTLAGEISPKSALVQLPLCINIERQATAEAHGLRLWQEAAKIENQPGILSVSCLYGFPYSDVAEMGATVLAVSSDSQEQARKAAEEMGAFWWHHRRDFDGQLLSVEDAVRQAADTRQIDPTRPVGLLEMGDNVGGGSPGDGTWIVHEWLRQGRGNRSSETRNAERLLVVIADPEAVRAATAAGAGAGISMSVGGKLDPSRHGPPIQGEFEVQRLTDGKFFETEARHGGYSRFDQGPTAVLTSPSGVTVIATTHRVAPMSLQQVVSQAIDPGDFSVIVIKGVHAPVAAYAPVCSRLIRVNTDGATTADLSRLRFHNRRRPMHPFEPMESGV